MSTVAELIKVLKSLENEEEATIKVVMYNGTLSSIDHIDWNEKENCYTIVCFGEEPLEEGDL